MPPHRSLAACLVAQDPGSLAQFWAALLGRRITPDSRGLLVPGPDAEVALRVVPGDVGTAGPNRLHLHLASETSGHQQAIVEHALRRGARPLDVGQTDDDLHVVLADPEGNELCVIEPGNSFLDGCGLLAEVACDGGRAVGAFWSEALGWPLVWDQDDETAVQSPAGGTKVAWGGTSTRTADAGRTFLELALAGGDAATEVGRLVSIGATELGVAADGVPWMADPEGVAFRLVVP